MSEKRKDSKGRVLKDGESQRANGTYDYRYTDIHKKRRCIYAKSLTELRKKEEELWRDLAASQIEYACSTKQSNRRRLIRRLFPTQRTNLHLSSFVISRSLLMPMPE